MKPAEEVYIDLGDPAGSSDMTCRTCEALSIRMLSRWQSVCVTLPVDLVVAVELHARHTHGQNFSLAAEELVARGLDHLRAELQERG